MQMERKRQKGKTKAEMVLEYLDMYNHISSRQAREMFSVASLKNMVYRLRRRGYTFKVEKAPKGLNKMYTKYWLLDRPQIGRRTELEYVLYTNYGFGWEEEFAAKTKEEIQSAEKNYHENVPGIRTKIKVIRVSGG